jgi:hypothetical protein
LTADSWLTLCREMLGAGMQHAADPCDFHRAQWRVAVAAVLIVLGVGNEQELAVGMARFDEVMTDLFESWADAGFSFGDEALLVAVANLLTQEFGDE